MIRIKRNNECIRILLKICENEKKECKNNISETKIKE